MTRPIKIGLPKCECGKTKIFTNGAWQCRRCCPTQKSMEDMARVIERRKESNGVGYRTASNCTGQNKLLHHVKKPPRSWRPKWADPGTWHSEVGVSLQILVECVRAGREPRIKAKTS